MVVQAGWAEAARLDVSAPPGGWIFGLPYPLRNLLRRWRGMVGMMIGVGIALAVVMSMLAMSKANMDHYTADFRKSGADLYVVTDQFPVPAGEDLQADPIPPTYHDRGGVAPHGRIRNPPGEGAAPATSPSKRSDSTKTRPRNG